MLTSAMLYNYRETLRQKFEVRVLKNTSYSLRSFARDIEIPASRLSEILNNKRGTTAENGQRIAKNLHLSRIETENFILSIEAQHSRSHTRKNAAKDQLLKNCKNDSTNFLNEDRFAVISSWYHYAILELLSTDQSFLGIDMIAKRLDLSLFQTKQALKRSFGKKLFVKKYDHVPLNISYIFNGKYPSKVSH